MSMHESGNSSNRPEKHVFRLGVLNTSKEARVNHKVKPSTLFVAYHLLPAKFIMSRKSTGRSRVPNWNAPLELAGKGYVELLWIPLITCFWKCYQVAGFVYSVNWKLTRKRTKQNQIPFIKTNDHSGHYSLWHHYCTHFSHSLWHVISLLNLLPWLGLLTVFFKFLLTYLLTQIYINKYLSTRTAAARHLWMRTFRKPLNSSFK